MTYVYCYISPADKCYVGITSDLQRRKVQHNWYANNTDCSTAFCRAIRKYGYDSFRFMVLDECETREEAAETEKMCIELLNSLVPNGYNLTTGGEGGHAFAEEVKEKMRNANGNYTGKSRAFNKRNESCIPHTNDLEVTPIPGIDNYVVIDSWIYHVNNGRLTGEVSSYNRLSANKGKYFSLYKGNGSTQQASSTTLKKVLKSINSRIDLQSKWRLKSKTPP